MIFFLKYFLLAAVLAFYVIYTVRYAILFNRNSVFTGRRKVLHAVMIWLIPFIWIWMLQIIIKPIPGSHDFNSKKDPDALKENTEDWVVWAASASSESNDSNG